MRESYSTRQNVYIIAGIRKGKSAKQVHGDHGVATNIRTVLKGHCVLPGGNVLSEPSLIHETVTPQDD